MNQVQNQEKGIRLDVSPRQIFVILGMFVVFFIAPAIVLTPREVSTVEESYTQTALTTENANQGRVAGISTEVEPQIQEGYFQLPGTGYQFNSDLSNPATLAILVGGIFGFISIILFLSMFFDFFKA